MTATVWDFFFIMFLRIHSCITNRSFLRKSSLTGAENGTHKTKDEAPALPRSGLPSRKILSTGGQLKESGSDSTRDDSFSNGKTSTLETTIRKDLILKHTKEIIFINKPAGIDVQGPEPDSIEALMNKGELSLNPSDNLKYDTTIFE